MTSGKFSTDAHITIAFLNVAIRCVFSLLLVSLAFQIMFRAISMFYGSSHFEGAMLMHVWGKMFALMLLLCTCISFSGILLSASLLIPGAYRGISQSSLPAESSRYAQ